MNNLLIAVLVVVVLVAVLTPLISDEWEDGWLEYQVQLRLPEDKQLKTTRYFTSQTDRYDLADIDDGTIMPGEQADENPFTVRLGHGRQVIFGGRITLSETREEYLYLRIEFTDGTHACRCGSYTVKPSGRA